MPNLAKLKIGDFVLDASRNYLVGAAGEITLEPKVVDVLLALAARPGVVLSRDELIDAVWKTEFGADERLTRAISMLRKAFHDERGTTQYIETVAKRGYRLVAAVSAADDADSLPAQEPVHEPSKALPQQTRRRYAVAGAIAAVLGVAGIAVLGWAGWFESARAKDVVELRPFFVIDGKPELNAIARQAHASVKRIVASNQVLLIDGTGKELGDGALNEAEFTLSGSLEQIGERYAVTLYLDSRKDGQTLWSFRFVRPVVEVEALNEQAGSHAAYVITCALTQRGKARVKPSQDAFKIYLETCNPELVWDDTPKLLAIAQRLIDIAPNDAYGHGLAAVHYASNSGEYGNNKTVAASYRAAARKAITRTKEIDPTSALARIAEIFIATPAERWRAQEAHFKRANFEYQVYQGTFIWSLRSSGRLTEALSVIENAAAATPLSPAHKVTRAIIYMHQGYHEAAERLFSETLRLWPDHEDAHWFRFVNAAFYGDPERALTLLEPVSKQVHWNQEERGCWQSFIEARARGGNGDGPAAVRKACAGETQVDQTVRKLAALGDTDGAFDLARNHSFGAVGSTIFLFYPEMAQFRRDARFMPFIADSGLLEAWTTTDQWPDFCNDKQLSYDCKAAAKRALEKRSVRASGVPASPPKAR